MKMKILLIIIVIVSGIIALVATSAIIVPLMEENHQIECVYDGGKVTGFLQCTRIHMDYSIEPTTIRINMGASDPQEKNSIHPKQMTVVLGENNTVTWLNTDGPSHFINFEDWSIGPIHQGERQSITFNYTGVYKYSSIDSPSILGAITVKSSMDKKDLDEFAVILDKLNQDSIIYQNNSNQKEFEKNKVLMSKKQAEIASKILKVDISDAYVAEGWNFPFRDISEVKIINPEFKKPICNISERIPYHLQKIQQSEMFQIFVGKYFEYELKIDISDERNHEGLIHYDLIAVSENESFTASTYFHLDSCTEEMKWPYFLWCKDNQKDEHISTRIKSEIISSIENDEFCSIEFEPWHQNIRDYQLKISSERDGLEGKLENATDEKESHEISFELRRLGLLNNITRYYESGNTESADLQKDISKYNKMFGDIPEELKLITKNI